MSIADERSQTDSLTRSTNIDMTNDMTLTNETNETMTNDMTQHEHVRSENYQGKTDGCTNTIKCPFWIFCRSIV